MRYSNHALTGSVEIDVVGIQLPVVELLERPEVVHQILLPLPLLVPFDASELVHLQEGKRSMLAN